MKRVLILFLFISVNSFSQTQTLSYDILLKNESIGLMKATRIIQKDHVSFLIESHILIDKVIKVKIDYTITAEFHNGKLLKSSTIQYANGKKQVDSQTKWMGNNYFVTTLSGNTKLKEKLIDYNLCTLYFVEPENRKKIWSDSVGKFLSIDSKEKHRYKLSLPESKEITYTYNYGICSMVEMEQLFSQIKFILK